MVSSLKINAEVLLLFYVVGAFLERLYIIATSSNSKMRVEYAGMGPLARVP
jgi:hypothetical protein